jgi:transposase-like protein
MAAEKRYPDELRERAVKMVLEIRGRDGKGHGEIARVARQLDVLRALLRGSRRSVLRSRPALLGALSLRSPLMSRGNLPRE